MKDVVVWSGGADSTYLLNDLAKKSSVEEPVYAYGIKHVCISDLKNEAETRTRNRLLKLFKKRGYHIEYREISVDVTHWSHVHNGQPTAWLATIMQFAPLESILHFGYVYEDSIWHAKTEMIEAFKALKKLRRIGGIREMELKFDLEWTPKKDIITGLIRENLFKYIWTCESPEKKTKQCGTCVACKTQSKILEEIDKEKKEMEIKEEKVKNA